MKNSYTYLLLGLLLSLCITGLQAQKLGYQEPVSAIKNIIDAPPTPGVDMSPDGQWILLEERSSLPTIEELAQPELRIGGLRINPRTNGPSRSGYVTGLKIRPMEGGENVAIEGLPETPRLRSISWSPDGQHIAFTHTTASGIELWVADVDTRKARKLTAAHVNAAIRGSAYTWLRGETPSIIYRACVNDRGEVPQKKLTPKGPVIQENVGAAAAVRTYQDLLKSPHDEDVFSYFATSQITHLSMDGQATAWGEPGLFTRVSPSPDGNYILVSRMVKPFSYLVPYYRFPQIMDIWTRDGKAHMNLANIPLAERMPKGFMAVRTGPRGHSWRADKPATLAWVEAMDGGDPKEMVEYRDQLFMLDAPFKGEPVEGPKTKLRFGGVTWGDGDMAVVEEQWWNTRQVRVGAFSPDQPGELKELFSYSTENRYGLPGDFMTHRNDWGRQVLLTDGKGESLFLRGMGASPDGNRPFIDQYDIASGEKERWWRSEAPYFEYPADILDVKKRHILTSRESNKEPANFYIRDLKKEKTTQITDFPHPYPAMKSVQKKMISYTRNDGVPLTGTLYTPPGYDPEEDGPIPVLLWAYPREFKSMANAGQVSGSPHTFTRIRTGSAIFWVLQGYAVLDNASFPVIGEGDKEPNDTFVEQLVGNGEAAINKLKEMGITDGTRIAVGGHSYGAFMTANLLAHSDLFTCGIARSGAYNRTLTPFGFQREERTFWEAPMLYFGMSPFMHADKVNEPILLIHGQADNNSGTFPIQSERFYAALKGHGAQARLVMLPHESHGYRARESVLHMLWEMDTFMQKHMGPGFQQESNSLNADN
ncbi:MAG: prolyl oligopeptidase family serine peptidase [Bacteroidota bacterium]